MKLAVIGVGLIGGSFALALKQAKVASHVVGVGRNPANLKLALERGAIDSIAPDPAAAARGADLVLLATPVSHYLKILSSLSLHSTLIVTDAGSTKRDVIVAARSALKEKIAQFVPGHPIAGAEKSGVAAATPELFRNRRVVLTPLPENPAAAVDKVKADGDEQIGINIVKRAITEPLRQIVENAGEEGAVILGKVLESKESNYGFNAFSNEYEDLVKAGVLDPTKVVRTALQNAGSIASLMLTTEALVAEIPEKKEAPAAPGHGGGMGDMY